MAPKKDKDKAKSEKEKQPSFDHDIVSQQVTDLADESFQKVHRSLEAMLLMLNAPERDAKVAEAKAGAVRTFVQSGGVAALFELSQRLVSELVLQRGMELDAFDPDRHTIADAASSLAADVLGTASELTNVLDWLLRGERLEKLTQAVKSLVAIPVARVKPDGERAGSPAFAPEAVDLATPAAHAPELAPAMDAPDAGDLDAAPAEAAPSEAPDPRPTPGVLSKGERALLERLLRVLVAVGESAPGKVALRASGAVEAVVGVVRDPVWQAHSYAGIRSSAVWVLARVAESPSSRVFLRGRGLLRELLVALAQERDPVGRAKGLLLAAFACYDAPARADLVRCGLCAVLLDQIQNYAEQGIGAPPLGPGASVAADGTDVDSEAAAAAAMAAAADWPLQRLEALANAGMTLAIVVNADGAEVAFAAAPAGTHALGVVSRALLRVCTEAIPDPALEDRAAPLASNLALVLAHTAADAASEPGVTANAEAAVSALDAAVHLDLATHEVTVLHALTALGHCHRSLRARATATAAGLPAHFVRLARSCLRGMPECAGEDADRPDVAAAALFALATALTDSGCHAEVIAAPLGAVDLLATALASDEASVRRPAAAALAGLVHMPKARRLLARAPTAQEAKEAAEAAEAEAAEAAEAAAAAAGRAKKGGGAKADAKSPSKGSRPSHAEPVAAAAGDSISGADSATSYAPTPPHPAVVELVRALSSRDAGLRVAAAQAIGVFARLAPAAAMLADEGAVSALAALAARDLAVEPAGPAAADALEHIADAHAPTALWLRGRVAAHELVAEGFYALPVGEPYRPPREALTATWRDGSRQVEALSVSPLTDPEIRSLVARADEAVKGRATGEAVLALARIVNQRMGGAVPWREYEHFSCATAVHAAMAAAQSTTVAVTRLTRGGAFHRAVLFKALADLTAHEVTASLCSGARGRGAHANHMWNEVTVNGHAFVVDLLHSVGELYRVDSDEADRYLRVGQHAFDSLMSSHRAQTPVHTLVRDGNLSRDVADFRGQVIKAMVIPTLMDRQARTTSTATASASRASAAAGRDM